jgi:hypothetical protein
VIAIAGIGPACARSCSSCATAVFAISDAVALTPEHSVGDRPRLYTTKTGEPVVVPLPALVVEALPSVAISRL